MAHPTMYLIRRENTKFIGPVTRNELRDSLRRMDFGIQDEVSGSCGTWVVLDQRDALARHYPELVDVIADELPVAWQEAAGHARSRTKKQLKASLSDAPKTQKIGRKIKNERAQNRSRGGRQNRFAWIVLVLSMCGIAGLLALKNRDDSLPPINEINTLAQKADPSDFLNAMGLKLSSVANRVRANKDPQGLWLGHLRMYAFYTSGNVDGLPLKILRGAVPVFAPPDCSVDTWKKRWKDGGSQIAGMVAGNKLVRNQWTKALAWDPWWIKRRVAKGWIRPRNWFEGCLMSASVALRTVAAEPNYGLESDPITGDVLAAITRRLQTQIEIIQSGRSGVPNDQHDVLSAMSCIEQSESAANGSHCRVKVSDPGVQSALDDHYGWQLMRIAAQQNLGIVDAAWLQELQGVFPAMSVEDVVSRVDYGAEFKFLQLLNQAGGKLDGLVDQVNSEFADVRLRL